LEQKPLRVLSYRKMGTDATTINGAPIAPLPQQPSLPPTTTHQQDVTTAGQRKVNLIWEYTQAIIAVFVVTANIVVWINAALKGASPPISEGLTNAMFLIIGFYFSRTNHAAIGGVGSKPSQDYLGR
jgi:hypothetical protein